MSSINKINLNNIPNVINDSSYLSIVETNTPSQANIFFKSLLLKPFNIYGEIYKRSSLKDIDNILEKFISRK